MLCKPMTAYDLDPDVVRWNLHLLDVCTLSNDTFGNMVTQYDADLSRVEYVREGYIEPFNVENDEVIAKAYQEELSRLAKAEASGCPNLGEENLQASILAQDWLGPSKRHGDSECQPCVGHGDDWKTEDGYGRLGYSDDHIDKENVAFDYTKSQEEANDSCKWINEEAGDDMGTLFTHTYPVGNSGNGEGWLLDIADESPLDGEVGRRLNTMVPAPHVPKTNEKIPTVDEELSDHERLLERLQLYEVVEHKVQGDGNCQFRALSDQLYRSPDYHGVVRELVVKQLKSYPEMYEGYVPMAYVDYLKKISKNGEWGDHVTLQAAADSYGIKIFVITSFKDTCSIEILPHTQKSKRVIFLSFWAEVHYNSIYPEGELPPPYENEKKKKKWWNW
ncbi:OVARIAN TUMOR DOMAIN-containing deubiquitinating enzyme 9 isoform X2 [Ziziphus jujuba]|uniref:OVARIAN TUMOR DOMAIN-containing deubiquitinating enzyme 9 isoform X2 n=1 Tax=Ziziphus jujuba TaxID=326968 RepID=A0ABM3IDT1_ZIZJJ|nr:OVARIAN TUMOR DOMAIN-containing deubiquitinating enzyme 9 isoform X2 [Ziziphus jujuba]